MANPPSSDTTLADFGANEWLVEEKREHFDQDPGSVDPAWRRYFEGQDEQGGNGAAGATGSGGYAAPSGDTSAPSGVTAPGKTLA